MTGTRGGADDTLARPASGAGRSGQPPGTPAPRRWRLGVLAATLAVLAVAGYARWHPSNSGGAGASTGSDRVAPMVGVGASPAAASTPHPSALPQGDTAVVDRLWTTGSLRGTQLDGDWGTWVGNVLQPGRNLRRRFDQLLSTQGEAPLASLRPWIAAQVRAEHGDAGAAQVLEVWDHYVLLQQTPAPGRVDVNDPGTWQAALAEHSRLRRRILGSAWAEAFYGDEERQLAAFTAEQLAGSAASPSVGAATERALQPPAADLPPERLQAERTARFGADAAARLLANDAAWADWQRRIAAARAEWAALAAAPQLSDVQRADAQARLLQDRFTAAELPRARALVPAVP